MTLPVNPPPDCWANRQDLLAEVAAKMWRHGQVWSPAYLRQLVDRGLPAPGRAPIPMAPVWEYLATTWRAEVRGSRAAASEAAAGLGPQAPPDEAELRAAKLAAEVGILEAKLAKLSGTMVPADEARDAILAAAAQVRARLRSDIPAQALEHARNKGVEDAMESIREDIDEALGALAQAAEMMSRRDGDAD